MTCKVGEKSASMYPMFNEELLCLTKIKIIVRPRSYRPDRPMAIP